jgi:hypothetical protein
MSNRTEARSAKAARMHATGRLPLLRLFSTPLIIAASTCLFHRESCDAQSLVSIRCTHMPDYCEYHCSPRALIFSPASWPKP